MATVSCRSDEQTVCFLGDSLVENWDVVSCFPATVAYNLGKAGCGVDHLATFEGTLAGKTAVVLVGTNDSYRFTESRIENYATRYLDIIAALGADRVLLVSVLPRSTDWDPADLGDDIRRFNALIKSRVEAMPGFCYVDVHDAFLHDGDINRSYYMPDGLHLSDEGYRILSNYVMQCL